MSPGTQDERCDAERPDAKPMVTDFRWVMWMSDFVQSKLVCVPPQAPARRTLKLVESFNSSSRDAISQSLLVGRRVSVPLRQAYGSMPLALALALAIRLIIERHVGRWFRNRRTASFMAYGDRPEVSH